MAKKKTRKELLKGPDEFMTFSERVVRYVQDRSRAFILAGVVLFLIILGYVGLTWYMDFENRRAQEVYNKAYYTLRNAEASGDRLEDPSVPANYFREVTSNHRLARVTNLVLPQLASLEFQQGNLDEAIESYKKFKEQSRGNKPYYALAGLALSACFEARGQYDAAISQLDPIIADPESFLREQALFRLVRLHRLNGRLDKAREAHESLAGDFPGSPFLLIAEGLLN